MRKSRFTEEQIIGVLKESEAGVCDGGSVSKALRQSADLLSTAAGAVRYYVSTRSEKERILSEFTQVTSFHRKHAIRVLNQLARQLDRNERHLALLCLQ